MCVFICVYVGLSGIYLKESGRIRTTAVPYAPHRRGCTWLGLQGMAGFSFLVSPARHGHVSGLLWACWSSGTIIWEHKTSGFVMVRLANKGRIFGKKNKLFNQEKKMSIRLFCSNICLFGKTWWDFSILNVYFSVPGTYFSTLRLGHEHLDHFFTLLWNKDLWS